MIQDERYPFRKSWRWQFVRLIDFLLSFFSAWVCRRAFPHPIKHILVVRLDQIGDSVCSLPVFSILKGRFPDAKITALVGTEGEAILAHNPWIDQILVFRSNWFSRSGRFNLFEYFKVVSSLRKMNLDLGYD